MDLSDVGHGPTAGAGSASSGRPADARAEESERLHGWLAQIGAEIAGPLTAAIERINILASTGRIDRDSLRQLRDEVQAARQAGMIGQQLSRFAAGRIRQSHERVELADAVDQVLSHRQRETEARGVSFKPSLAPVTVVCDASLLSSLLDSTVDWALASTGSHVEFKIELPSSPATARLVCRFAQRRAESLLLDGPGTPTLPSFDSLTWRLLEQTSRAIGVRLERSLDSSDGNITLSIEFATAVDPNSSALSDASDASDNDGGFAGSMNSRPLAGSHVLVIASRREMRVSIRDALRSMNLIVDFVNSVDEAAAFCREGLPHAIIIESIQAGERFAQFRQGIRAELPEFVFIEIVEEGKVFEMSKAGGPSMARVGREVLAGSLPSALMFELAKGP